MIDKDNRFRLYVCQGNWVTADCSAELKPGHWHLVGVVVRPGSAELWVNGKLAGAVPLTRPVPQTTAPLTFGGVDDNGRIRQNFVGALDEVRLFDRPLDTTQMAAAYKLVTATHRIPERLAFGRELRRKSHESRSGAKSATGPESGRSFTLWTGSRVPTTSAAEVLSGVQFHVIKRYERDLDGYGFLHGVALAWHKGRLYA